MRIITISREFGSGGRELGKRLADLLEYDYYDKEILTAIAENKGMDSEYVSRVLSNHGWLKYPLTFRSSFSSPTVNLHIQLLLEEMNVIREIAALGKTALLLAEVPMCFCRNTIRSISLSVQICRPRSNAVWNGLIRAKSWQKRI